jgi:hypothetical protein
MSRMTYNRPPNWPEPPPGWEPKRGWHPDPSWPPPPDGWEVWVPAPPGKTPVGAFGPRFGRRKVVAVVAVVAAGTALSFGLSMCGRGGTGPDYTTTQQPGDVTITGCTGKPIEPVNGVSYGDGPWATFEITNHSHSTEDYKVIIGFLPVGGGAEFATGYIDVLSLRAGQNSTQQSLYLSASSWTSAPADGYTCKVDSVERSGASNPNDPPSTYP